MELNLVVLSGRLAAHPEMRHHGGRPGCVRYLVTVLSEQPERRLDVVPVTMWDPPPALVERVPAPGTRVWVTGSVQRRFWSGGGERRSRLEIVATHVEVRPEPGGEEQREAADPGGATGEPPPRDN